MARIGQAQLAVWISEECMVRLKSLAAESGNPIRVVIEQAIAAYTPGAVDAPVDRLTAIEARIAALESRSATSQKLDKLDKLETDEVTSQKLDKLDKLDKLETDEVTSHELDGLDKPETDDLSGVLAALAAQGLTPSAIAAELNRRGFRTANGAEFTRGNSRISRAIKAALELRHD